METENGHRSWTWELRPPRVMLADDDEAERARLAQLLRSDGYQVDEAEDAEEVLDALLAYPAGPAEPVDVLIADERMPCCLGSTLLAHLRKMETHTPLVLLHHQGESARDVGGAPPEYVIDADDIHGVRGAIFQLTHAF